LPPLSLWLLGLLLLLLLLLPMMAMVVHQTGLRR